MPAGFLFNGALSTYEKLGFTRDRKIGKHRWVGRDQGRRAKVVGDAGHMLTPVAARAGADFPNWLCAAAGAK